MIGTRSLKPSRECDIFCDGCGDSGVEPGCYGIKLRRLSYFAHDRDHTAVAALVLLVNNETVFQDRILRGRRPALNEESVVLFRGHLDEYFHTKNLTLADVGEKGGP